MQASPRPSTQFSASWLLVMFATALLALFLTLESGGINSKSSMHQTNTDVIEELRPKPAEHASITRSEPAEAESFNWYQVPVREAVCRNQREQNLKWSPPPLKSLAKNRPTLAQPIALPNWLSDRSTFLTKLCPGVFHGWPVGEGICSDAIRQTSHFDCVLNFPAPIPSVL